MVTGFDVDARGKAASTGTWVSIQSDSSEKGKSKRRPSFPLLKAEWVSLRRRF